MGKADTLAKRCFSKNERFADIVNYLVFDGKPVVKPEELEERDPTEIGIVPRVTRSVLTKQKVRDNTLFPVCREITSIITEE